MVKRDVHIEHGAESQDWPRQGPTIFILVVETCCFSGQSNKAELLHVSPMLEDSDFRMPPMVTKCIISIKTIFPSFEDHHLDYKKLKSATSERSNNKNHILQGYLLLTYPLKTLVKMNP